MRNQLEGLNSIREYYIGKLEAYENAMKLLDPRYGDAIHGIIHDVKASIAFYDREIEKFKEELTIK